MKVVAWLAVLWVAGCAAQPQMVMLNPRTGAVVGCPVPDPLASSGEFLVSRACLSACQAHGFRAVPNAPSATGGSDTPTQCLN